jgi:hypothetical protein
VVAEMIQVYGEDSILVKMAAVMFGSTETTFYVVAVYFGAVNIKKTRHAVPAGLTADIAAMMIALWTGGCCSGRDTRHQVRSQSVRIGTACSPSPKLALVSPS